MLAERIASIRKEVEAMEGKMRQGETASEPELERILVAEREARKKEIKLTEINKLEPREATIPPSTDEKGRAAVV